MKICQELWTTCCIAGEVFTSKLLISPTQHPNHNCYYYKVNSVFFWFSQNFILVQQKYDTKYKRWEEVGEVGATLKVDIFLKFEIFLNFYFFHKFDIFTKFDIFVKFDFFIKFVFFLKLLFSYFRFDILIKNSWFFDQIHIVVNLIFLSTIDKNIKNPSFLFP